VAAEPPTVPKIVAASDCAESPVALDGQPMPVCLQAHISQCDSHTQGGFDQQPDGACASGGAVHVLYVTARTAMGGTTISARYTAAMAECGGAVRSSPAFSAALPTTTAGTAGCRSTGPRRAAVVPRRAAPCSRYCAGGGCPAPVGAPWDERSVKALVSAGPAGRSGSTRTSTGAAARKAGLHGPMSVKSLSGWCACELVLDEALVGGLGMEGELAFSLTHQLVSRPRPGNADAVGELASEIILTDRVRKQSR
jgi:hypothetical protein